MSANPDTDRFVGVSEATEAAATAADESSAPPPRSTEGRLLRRLLESVGGPPMAVALWNGERLDPPGNAAPVTLHIRDRGALLSLLRDPQMQFGETYSAGRVEVEGDLVQFMELLYHAGARARTRPSMAHRVADWMRRPRHNSLTGSRENIHHHYDIGNDFYALWLGETMAYTCAYYPTLAATLEQAQIAKMDHVCRKLRVKPGDSVVEAGCGWGSLALHMASRYGARVRAFNISHQQIVYARERARALGLDGRVEFVEDDYRNIHGRYDVFASVGMLEHVGVENYSELGRIVRSSLTDSGRGLIHSIGRNWPAPLQPWIVRRIFPGAYAPTLGEMMQIFEPWDLSVLDVENIRLHYARTLRHWLERFEASVDRVRAMFDERFVRMWRLYLAGSIAGFAAGTLQLFQVVFTTQENNDIPLTRQYLYNP